MTSTFRATARAPESAAALAALAWLHTARFLTTSSQLDQLPVTELPEIAFVGRSNAGKSTAINTLAQHKRLAFASRTPGRTQHINVFALGPKDEPDAWFADLPGYGYAAVDRSLLELIKPRVITGELRLLVLLTKADKLNRRESDAALSAANEVLGDLAGDQTDIGVSLFSALSRRGLGDAAEALRQWVPAPAALA